MPRTSTGAKSSQEVSSSNRATSSQGGSKNLKAEEIFKLANDVVYYVLVIDQKKIPFKRTDINKNVLKEHSSMFTIILKEAKSILDSTFGIELIEVPDKRGTYFLANKLFVDDENSHLMWSQEENTKTGLLFIILSLIFMNGNIIQDNMLWLTLKRMGVDAEDLKPHPVFGDVKKLITVEFVKQLYLEYTQIENKDPPTYEFKWGARAVREISKRDILDFVCHIYGNMKMSMWKSQYQDMLKSKGGHVEEGNENTEAESSGSRRKA